MGLERLSVYFDVVLDQLAIRAEFLDGIVGVGGPVARRGPRVAKAVRVWAI